MAFWFLIIFVSYVYLWLVLGERNSFNGTALALLGITTATGLISRGIDASKRGNVSQLQAEKSQLDAKVARLSPLVAQLTDTQRAELAAAPARSAELAKTIDAATVPVADHKSEGFLTDILSDESGISLQRLQMLGWTLVLGMVFVADVWNNYSMPDFDNTLLGLMGISSGTYIGFKVPEKKDVPTT
jgi:hypothetical protein